MKSQPQEAAAVQLGCHHALNASAAVTPPVLILAFSSRFLLACAHMAPGQVKAGVTADCAAEQSSTASWSLCLVLGVCAASEAGGKGRG